VAVDAPDDGVDVWLKQGEDGCVLIAVNLLERAVTAAIEAEALQGVKRLHGFRDNTSARVRSGRLKLRFAPYQVYILTNPAIHAVNGAGAKQLTAILEEIGSARAALRKRGNLLFGRGREVIWDASHKYISPKSLSSLADGVTDCLGFKAIGGSRDSAWITMTFGSFKPRFRRMRIYTSTVSDLEVQAFPAGEWITLAAVRGHTGPVISIDLPEPIRPDTLRILMTGLTRAGQRSAHGWGGGSPEICEIELYE
jgi:hypothetical protein